MGPHSTAHSMSELYRRQADNKNSSLNNIDIIGIQVHRFPHQNTELQYTNINNYQLITAYAIKNTPRASSNLLNIEKITLSLLNSTASQQ